MMTFRISIALFIIFALAAPAIAHSAGVKEYFITCNPDELAYIYEHYEENKYIAATFTFDGRTWDSVEMRIRGDGTRRLPKKSLKFRFNSVPFVNGRSKLNFNAEWDDPSYISQYLSARLMREAGVHCFGAEHARIYINGDFFGLYLRIENVGKDFLAARGIEENGNLYKAALDGACLSPNEDVYELWEKKTNKNSGMDDLEELIYDINNVSDEDYLEFTKSTFQFGKMINIISINMLISNWSTYYHNYYMFHDINNTKKWEMFPWDMDKTFGKYAINLPYTTSSGNWTRDNPFPERAVMNDTILALIKQRTEELKLSLFSEEYLFPIIDSLAAVLEESVSEDNTDNVSDKEEWLENIELKRTFIRKRYEELTKQIDLAPRNFRVNPAPDIFTNVLKFSWHRSANPAVGNLSYEFYCSTNKNFLLENTVVIKDITDTSIVLASKPEEGVYYWQVRAKNDYYTTVGYDSYGKFEYRKASALPCTINEDMVLTAEGSPYRVECDVTVTPNTVLTVNPGVIIVFGRMKSIIVNGEIHINGAAGNPVALMPEHNSRWNQLQISNATGASSVTNANITLGSISIEYSDVTIDGIEMNFDSSFTAGENMIAALSGSLALSNSKFTGNGESGCIVGEGGDIAIFNNIIGNTSGAIKLTNVSDGEIRNNRIIGSMGDGININGSSNISILRNTIIKAADKGISLGYYGEKPSVNNMLAFNIIAGCATGISVKDSSAVDIVNNTLYNNSTGINCYQKMPGLGGGKADVVNTIISQSGTPFEIDYLSGITFSYSLSDEELLPGNGNVMANPGLVNPENSDFNLRKNSPCINTGNPSSPKDADGTIADIGALSFYTPQTKIVINEINYNPADDFNTGDWIELYNANGTDVDLSGWIFKDGDDSHEFIIPDGTIIGRGTYLVLCRHSGRFAGIYPDVSNYIGDFNFGLSSSGELLRIYDTGGIIVDSLAFLPNLPWPESPNGNGPTLELINPLIDNSRAKYWLASCQTYGTPGKLNCAFNPNDVGKENIIPGKDIISGPFPNPAGDISAVRFNAALINKFKLQLVGSNGIIIKELINAGQIPTGSMININVGGLAGGLYFVKLTTADRIITKPLIVLR